MRLALILVLSIAVLGCTVEATDDAPTAPAAEPNRIAGKVVEMWDAANYTYLRLETPEGEAWAAVPQTRLDIGAQVALVNPQAMSNFESKTLGRTFETIYFGTLEGQGAPAPMGTGGSNPHGSMQGGMTGSPAGKPAADAGPIDVAKAEGPTGRTVAELYAGKGELSGKTVTLRGKVVKFSSGIMGRNWIHLQDGTGDKAAGTHDITVTSIDSVAVGETILIEGVVTVDKDFGAGYRYAVIVEEAKVK